MAIASVAALSLGLASCGDDDDASDTVPGGTDGAETSLPATTRPTTTRPTTTAGDATTEPATAGTGSPTTTAGGTTTSPTTTPAGGTVDAATGTEVAGTDAAATGDTPAGPAEEPATEGTATDGTATDTSEVAAGPTTTGPECEFGENVEFPIERCNIGPPVAAIQSVLSTLGYEITSIDCQFGDQTLYAVRAFQTDEELTVDGQVGSETWAALEQTFLADWGNDADGSGVIEPDELTIVCE